MKNKIASFVSGAQPIKTSRNRFDGPATMGPAPSATPSVPQPVVQFSNYGQPPAVPNLMRPDLELPGGGR